MAALDMKRQLVRLFGLSGPECIEQVGGEMTGESGFLSYRQRLVVSLPSGQRLSVFVKSSDASREDLGPLNVLSVWSCGRECDFYGLLAPILRRTARQFGLECTLPQVHLELSTTQGSLLVMEDLVSQGFELAPDVMTREQIRCVLSEFAKLQTVFWLTQHKLGGAGLVKAFPELLNRMDDPSKGSPICFDDMMPDTFKQFCDRFAEFMPDAKRRQIISDFLHDPEFIPKSKRVFASLYDEREAVGLQHFDLWHNNCMLRGERDCRIIDWQFHAIGAFGFDLGLLLETSADNSFAVDELDSFVEFFHSKVKVAFEEKSGTEFPVTLEKALEISRLSLRMTAYWCVLSADALWVQSNVTNLLNNMADGIAKFGS